MSLFVEPEEKLGLFRRNHFCVSFPYPTAEELLLFEHCDGLAAMCFRQDIGSVWAAVSCLMIAGGIGTDAALRE